MAEPITAVFHYTQDGQEKTLEKTYAAEDYVPAFDLAADYGEITDEKMITLVKAVADYGYYVQPFLSRERKWVLGTDYAKMEKHYTESYDIGAVQTAVSGKTVRKENSTNGDITKITYSLTLDSETAVNVYFTPKSGYTGKFSVTVDGAAAETDEKSGRYVVKIPGISAHQLGTAHQISVETENGTASVTVSALSYVDSMLKAYEGREDAENAACSLYWYAKRSEALRP